jgi:uncharacterized SAM-binding protein YcdF (DUF218 family)
MSHDDLWMLFKPSQVLLYLVLLGLVLGGLKQRRRLCWLILLCVLAAAVLPVGAWLVRTLEARFPAPELSERIDGIIVLAGAELAEQSIQTGEPQLSSFGDRLTSFLLLANRYPEARLIHSGAGVSARYSQSEVARQLLTGAGLSSERLRFESESENTCESAAALHRMLSPVAGERWVLVTSGFHMPRAIACFRAVDWEVLPYPADFRRSVGYVHFDVLQNLEDLDLAVHEWLGLLYYRLRGETEEIFPRP